MPGRFLDSNVLLYLMTSDDRKAVISKRLLDEGCDISVQVLNEIANVLCKKYRLPWEDVRRFLDTVKQLVEVVDVDLDIHIIGMGIAERFGFAIYDSMIVAAAIKTGCEFVMTEDLQHGQVIDGLLTVVNPFR
jgi:predicted nucleic acid-binding protein